MSRYSWFIGVIAVFSVAGCRPPVVVHHADASRGAVTVSVDGVPRARALRAGARVKLRLGPGRHVLAFTSQAGEGGVDDWVVELDRRATITLLPPPLEPLEGAEVSP